MNAEAKARLDCGIRSLERELARNGMFENAGQRQLMEFGEWLDRQDGIGYADRAVARDAFSEAVELAQGRHVAARDAR